MPPRYELCSNKGIELSPRPYLLDTNILLAAILAPERLPQEVGVQRAVFLFERFAQPVKVSLTVRFAKKAGLAVMPTQHDGQRNIIKMEAGAAEQAPS